MKLINYSFAMIFTNSVNFRPRFRFYSWATALLGVISAVTIAFTVNAVISGITYGVLLILAIIITYFAPPESKKWGSVSNPIIYQQLLRLHRSLTPDEEHVKFWYLRALVLVSNVKQNYQLLHFADNLASKGGLLMIGHVKIGEFENEVHSF
jgi:potassium/chloride transporter 9